MLSDDASITMDAPSYWMISAAWDINDTYSLYATARKTDWSSFSSLTLESPLVANVVKAADVAQGKVPAAAPLSMFPTSRPMNTQWRDTYLFTIGGDMRVNEFWTFRAGLGYERSPISQPELRTGTIPDADRWWFSVGSSLHWTKNFQTDIGLAHLHGVHERSLYNSNGQKKIGRFERLDAYLFGLQAQYRF